MRVADEITVTSTITKTGEDEYTINTTASANGLDVYRDAPREVEAVSKQAVFHHANSLISQARFAARNYLNQ